MSWRRRCIARNWKAPADSQIRTASPLGSGNDISATTVLWRVCFLVLPQPSAEQNEDRLETTAYATLHIASGKPFGGVRELKPQAAIQFKSLRYFPIRSNCKMAYIDKVTELELTPLLTKVPRLTGVCRYRKVSCKCRFSGTWEETC
jgi:hypothetical protein